MKDGGENGDEINVLLQIHFGVLIKGKFFYLHYYQLFEAGFKHYLQSFHRISFEMYFNPKQPYIIQVYALLLISMKL